MKLSRGAVAVVAYLVLGASLFTAGLRADLLAAYVLAGAVGGTAAFRRYRGLPENSREHGWTRKDLEYLRRGGELPGGRPRTERDGERP